MQEIIAAFGIDWRLITIQVVNFLILLAGLWYFLYTPVLSIIAKRKAVIDQGLSDAEAARSARHNAETESQSVIASAHEEASLVAARARTFAEEKTAQLLAEAEEKRNRIIKEAEQLGAERSAKLYRDSEAEIAKTALLAAEKILKERA